LPAKELSTFLCQTVLKKGMAAIGPMVFFIFEAVACFISEDSLDSDQCTNTSNAALFLSLNLALLATLSIVTKTVPKSVQRATSWDMSAVASLNLPWWQQLMGGLFSVMGFSSLFLLSALGVEGDPNDMIGVVGVIGSVSAGIATLIGSFALSRTHYEHQQSGGSLVGLPEEQISRGTAFSIGKMSEDMGGLGFI
jgi:hypothetical protein